MTAIAPVITATPGQQLANNAASLIITGQNFNASDTNVTLSSGTVQSVTFNSATQLTVTLNPATSLLAGGALTATVQGNNGTSNQAVVASVIGPASPATSTLSVSAASFVAGQTINVTLQAKDALGQNLTTGGLQVLFARAAGSSGGTLSAVTDNQNGTYTATFTSSVMGTSTFTATLNGAAVTSTASTSVIFQSDFPGTGALGATGAAYPCLSGVDWGECREGAIVDDCRPFKAEGFPHFIRVTYVFALTAAQKVAYHRARWDHILG